MASCSESSSARYSPCARQHLLVLVGMHENRDYDIDISAL